MTFIKGQSGNTKGQPKGWQENSSKMSEKTLRRVALEQERQTKLVEALSQGATFAAAADIANYSSRQSAWNAFKKIRENTSELLDVMNLPLPRILQKLGDQLEAKETKFFQNKGIITDQVDVSAHDIQQNAAIQLARLHSAYPSRDQEEHGAQVLTQIKVIIEDVSRQGERTLTAQATPAQ